MLQIIVPKIKAIWNNKYTSQNFINLKYIRNTDGSNLYLKKNTTPVQIPNVRV